MRSITVLFGVVFYIGVSCSSTVAGETKNPFILFLPALLGGGQGAQGNPDGGCSIPVAAAEENVSAPDHVIGTGSPQSCTSEAVVAAVASGGVITFNCGAAPVTIVMKETAKVFNKTGPKIVIDGGGKVTLSGNDERRILYMNTCDKNQVWTTAHCQNQDHPQLTLQNLTFVHGNS